MPVTQSDWFSFKSQIETRFNTDWLSAMRQAIVSTHESGWEWFSEYECLGNWRLFRNIGHFITPQLSLEFDQYDDLFKFNPEVHNCVRLDKNVANLDNIEEILDFLQKAMQSC